MQKSGFPKMRHYVGFWQIGSHIPIISNCHSQQYINYCCKNNLLYCCSLCLCNSAISFLHKAIVYKLALIPFSKDNDMHTHVYSISPNDSGRNQQNNQFLSPFLYNTVLYWLTILFIGSAFFY